jgi:hypothetical protein
MVLQPLVGHCILIIMASQTHLDDTSRSVRLLWVSDQPNTETST